MALGKVAKSSLDNYPAKKLIRKPWGYEILFHDGRLDNSGYVIKLIHINKGHRLSLQKHLVKHETIILQTDAEIYLERDKGIFIKQGTFGAWSVFPIPPDTIHRFSAKGLKKDVEILEVSTCQLDDVVRLEDDYGRV